MSYDIHTYELCTNCGRTFIPDEGSDIHEHDEDSICPTCRQYEKMFDELFGFDVRGG